MQTPLLAPICLWAQNQEASDTRFPTLGEAGGCRSIHTPPRNKALTKRNGCTSQLLKAQTSDKGGGRSFVHITHDRTPADTLLTWGHRCENGGHNPWELLTPLCLDTPSLLWPNALSSVHCRDEVMIFWGGWSVGSWVLGRGGVGTQATALKAWCFQKKTDEEKEN